MEAAVAKAVLDASRSMGSKSIDMAEFCAVPDDFAPTTSRRTPSNWSRSSSVETKRSAGAGAQHLSSNRYSESYWANTGIWSTGGRLNS